MISEHDRQVLQRIPSWDPRGALPSNAALGKIWRSPTIKIFQQLALSHKMSSCAPACVPMSRFPRGRIDIRS